MGSAGYRRGELLAYPQGTPLFNGGKPGQLRQAVQALLGRSTGSGIVYFGREKQPGRILSKVNWGIRFLEVNREPLDLYAEAKDSTEVVKIQGFYL